MPPLLHNDTLLTLRGSCSVLFMATTGRRVLSIQVWPTSDQLKLESKLETSVCLHAEEIVDAWTTQLIHTSSCVHTNKWLKQCLFCHRNNVLCCSFLKAMRDQFCYNNRRRLISFFLDMKLIRERGKLIKIIERLPNASCLSNIRCSARNLWRD